MRRLARDGQLDRALEFLPTDRQIRERLERRPGADPARSSRCCSPTPRSRSPTSCSRTALPDDPYLQQPAARLLPAARCASASPSRSTGTRCAARSSRRCWSTTWSTPAVRPSCSGCGRRPAPRSEEIVRAQTAAREIFGLGAGVGRGRGARQQGRRRRPDPDPAALAPARRARHALAARQPAAAAGARRDHRLLRASGSTQVWAELPKLLRGADLEWYQRSYDELTEAGVPDELATRVAGLLVRLPDARHRRDRGPHRQGPAGRRRGLLRPRRPAAASPS